MFEPGDYKTRGGDRAVVLEEFDGCLFGRVKRPSGWRAISWLASDGNAWGESIDYDLMQPKRVRYANVYPGSYRSRADADRGADDDRIACVRIEEGQYDD